MRTHFRAFEDFKLLFPSKREKVLKMRRGVLYPKISEYALGAPF